MKHIISQLMSAAGALLCVLAFWAVAALNASDGAAQLVIIGVPAGVGLYLGFRAGLHGLTLPVYSLVLMLALAHARVNPYYSADMHWQGPPLLYSMLLAPAAVLPVVLIVIVRAIRRMRKRPNQGMEDIVA